MTTGRGAVRLRGAGRVAGIAAGLAMVVVGCTAVTQGSATVDKADAPEYRASVASSSAARESERRAAIVKDAVHASCDALKSTSEESVDAVNAFVGAYNAESADAPAKAGPAVDALNRSADAVSGSLSDALSSSLRFVLTAWVDSARQLAGVISRNEGPSTFNVSIRLLNDAKISAGAGCNAAY